MQANHPWWHRAVIYQIYPRSFQDSSGNGIGDLQGIIQRLPYVADMGFDSVWLSPFYPSPMADFGYDISDYCNIDPLFGDLTTFAKLVQEAHWHGLRVIIDYVPNHTSDEHPWFIEARANRENPKRDWYIWKEPNEDGSPPNNWESYFGGPAWTLDEQTNQYYLHQFHTKQPDLNWRNADVQEAMFDVLHFWFDHGVDGVRMDVVGMIYKDQQFRDNPPLANPTQPPLTQARVYTENQPEVHEMIRQFRTLFDSYPKDKLLIGEIFGPLDVWRSYYGNNDELHIPFNFSLIFSAWNPTAIANVVNGIEDTLPAFAWPNYVLGNHDQPRLVSRIGEAQARVAAMLHLTLRGTPTVYYGDELGLSNGNIAPEHAVDPQATNGNGFNRDMSRTPMQWDGDQHSSFTTAASPWLPISDDYKQRNVEAQSRNATSLLSLYRALLALRREYEALEIGAYEFVHATEHTLVYKRILADATITVMLNFSAVAQMISLEQDGDVVLSTYLDAPRALASETVRLRPNEGIIVLIDDRQ